MKIYLISRVAEDARQLNMKAANNLRRAGHEVFVPHTAAYNQADNADSTDEDVYRQDMAEMLTADIAVVVGRIGVDCAFEVGWFQNHGTPTVWYAPPATKLGRHPMLHCVPRVGSMERVRKFLEKFDGAIQRAGARKAGAR